MLDGHGPSHASLMISVIVTFYNLEKCVDYCLDSLLSQNYKAVEFLLVDDGSTDGTSEKLDAYTIDSRVKVFHKSNGGLSDARNYGVAKATGEYVTFVDGDDIISPFYLEHLAAGVIYGKKTLVTSEYRVVSTDPSSYGWDFNRKEDSCYVRETREEALEELLYEEIKSSAPAKLAPREIYLRHPFPVGYYYEEISTAAHYISMVDEVVKYYGADYGYVMRPNSITHKKQATIKQAEDMLRAIGLLEEKCLDILGNVPAVNYQESLQMSRLYWLLHVVPECEQKTIIHSEVKRRIKKAYLNTMRDKRVNIFAKLRFTLLRFSPPLYTILFSAYERGKLV